ncbi:hypothetical protein C3E77_11785 [Mycetocola zhujimingii]|nr:prepilin-type N-terminal cleavage/methylation domain-containing protein [Mycetocola zhujimingii]AWB87231.1 hypothetical protein C3E77_11785 [Mycetocola zhujimingii]
MTLIELLVAMMVFAVIAVGVSMSITSVLSTTSGSRARVVATNLAASDIDFVRSLDDVFDVLTETYEREVDGTRFTINRSTSWISTAGTDVRCDSAGGALQYKRVNVTVTWQGNMSTEVRADTILTPGSRINEPTTGTILVSVKNAAGAGTPDVKVTATQTSEGGAITETPPLTDADGCSYLLKVVPGTYTVKLEKTGSVDNLHNPTPESVVTVLKGQSTSASFAYDAAARYSVTYAATPTPAAPLPGAIKIPTNMEVSVLGGGPPVVRALSSTMNLFPAGAGYQMIAGAFMPETIEEAGAPAAKESCMVVDPTSWVDDETATPPRVGQLPNLVAAKPPASTAITVPIGVVSITGDSEQRYLFAERITTPEVSASGQPACTDAVTYSFGDTVIPQGTNKTVTVGLPFGTWKLYTSPRSNGTNPTALDTTRVTVRTSTPPPPGSKTFTLDPRTALP